MPMLSLRSLCTLSIVFLQGALALVPTPNYAVFNNQQSRELIKSWAPKFVRSSEPGGSGLTPSSTENMQRFVKARILLEEQNTGCIASLDDSLSVIICRFDGQKHKVLLPLWRPNAQETVQANIFRGLRKWHKERLPQQELKAQLDWPEDRQAWAASMAQP